MFIGTWYEVQRYFSASQVLLGKCWVEKYLFSNTKGWYTLLQFTENISGKIITIENSINFGPEDIGTVSYFVAKPYVPFIRGQYKIVATDYDNYAIAYQCENKAFGTHTRMVWLLSRTPTLSDATIADARTAAENAGIVLEPLRDQKTKNCIYAQPID